MALPWDFLTNGTPADPNQPSIGSQFGQFLDDPRGRAALLQAGLSLAAGPTWGDTPMSQVARAVGSGGEAIGRQEEATRKQEDTDSKAALRMAQSDAATARSGQAGTMADLARERLGISRDRLTMDEERYKAATALSQRKWDDQIELAKSKLDLARTDSERRQAQADLDRVVKEARMEQDKIRTDYMGRRIDVAGATEEGKTNRMNLNARIRLSNQYQMERKATEEHNRKIQESVLLSPAEKQAQVKPPVPSYEDWLRARGFDPNILGSGTPGEPTPPVAPPPVGSGGPAPPAPVTGGGTPAATPVTYPPMPADPAERETGKIYTTPGRGPMKWTGTGWLPPS